MDLTFRIQLLKDSNQIDEETYENLLAIIKLLKDRWGITLTEENGAMLITHMSIALKRIKDNNTVNPLEEDLQEQLRGEAFYSKAEEILEDIDKKLELKLPENEKEYMIMHICTLLLK